MKKLGLFAYGETGLSALKGLVNYFEVLWIITPPKGLETQDSSSVEEMAKDKGIKIVRTNSNSEIYDLISKDIPAAVVISTYNKILSEKILKLTKFINIHHGALPRWRGRANINWAIILGRDEIGLTFHKASIDLDSGDIYAQFMVPITKDDNVKTVYDKFNNLIEMNLSDIVKKVIEGIKGKKQEMKGTYCCTRLPEDGLIDWKNGTIQIDRLVRALTKPYPGAFTYFEGKKLIIWESEIPKNPNIYEGRIPGRVVAIHRERGVEILTGDSSIIIKNVEYDGKETNASEVINSVKKTLGINIVQLYEAVQKLLEKQK